MTTRLIVIRHANTFDKGDIMKRVGRRTDLPLSRSGRKQSVRLGEHLHAKYGSIDIAYTGTLKRTRESAELILKSFENPPEPIAMTAFDEIDYGPDENQPEEDVVARVGKDAIRRWNEEALPPTGWNVNPEELIEMWKRFIYSIPDEKGRPNTVAVVTSNGVARFLLPAILGLEVAIANYSLKLSTAAYGVFNLDSDEMYCESWNIKP